MSDSLPPMDCSLLGFSVHGILQARILEWVAISSSGGSSWPRIKSGFPALQVDSLPSESLLLLLLSRFSRVRLCATPETAAHQAPHPRDSPGKNTGVGCHFLLQCRKVKSESEVTQSCPTLSDPMDCSLPGSFIHGICQARVLEWGAIAFSVWVTRKAKYIYVFKDLSAKTLSLTLNSSVTLELSALWIVKKNFI